MDDSTQHLGNDHGPDRPSDDLIALALGEISAADRARLESTLDPASLQLVLQLRGLAHTMRDGLLEAAPASLVRRAIALGRADALGEAMERLAGGLRRLVASIVFDSRVSPALAGFRGVAEGRQLVFASEGGEVHLRLTGPEDADPRITVRGTVEGVDPDALDSIACVARLGQGPQAIEASLDQDAMFVLKAAPGTYPMVIRLGDVEIDLGMLEVA